MVYSTVKTSRRLEVLVKTYIAAKSNVIGARLTYSYLFIGLTSQNPKCPNSEGFYIVVLKGNVQKQVAPAFSIKFAC